MHVPPVAQGLTLHVSSETTPLRIEKRVTSPIDSGRSTLPASSESSKLKSSTILVTFPPSLIWTSWMTPLKWRGVRPAGGVEGGEERVDEEEELSSRLRRVRSSRGSWK